MHPILQEGLNGFFITRMKKATAIPATVAMLLKKIYTRNFKNHPDIRWRLQQAFMIQKNQS
jgi:hypothetical protein